MTFYSSVSIDAICLSSWHFYILSVYHSSISSQFPNFPWNTLEGFAVSGLGRRSISQGQQSVVLVVQCTDWWGYVGSCPGLLLCINTWGCFLGSLSDFWAHKKILGDVQDFFSRVCHLCRETWVESIVLVFSGLVLKLTVLSSPGRLYKWALFFCCHWCEPSVFFVVFFLWHFNFLFEANGAISTNLAKSIICFNAESSIFLDGNEWK